MRTIQNPYSLLNRTFETGNAEVCHRENVGLLAYSPLAFGVLSGKYRQGNKPENGRITLFSNYNRYSNDQCNLAVDKYHELATANGMTLTQMALSFVNDRPFVTSNIIGATSLEQLNENIDTASIKLSSEVLQAINEIQELVPNPAP
jgi:aryl-alcohol dehydrogenase-like predicted oxidoreductase